METINEGSSRAQASQHSWLHHPFLPSPSAFFSWALLVNYNMVEYACVSILITFYTQQAMKDQLVEAALFLCLQEGLASLAAILLVRFTSQRLSRRFYAIVISTSSYIAGIMILWSYARHNPQEKKVPLFLVVSCLFALGKGGADPLLKSFLEHNLYESYNNIKSITRSSAEICINIWIQSAWILGAIIAIFGFIGLQWVRVFQISAIVMASSGLLFLFCANSTTTRPTMDQISVHRDATTVSPKRVIRNMKWLLMFSCIAYSLVLGTGNIFFQEQGNKMEALEIKGKEVRFSFMIVIKSALNEIIIMIFGLCGANKKQGIALVRIGSGMVCAIICCVIAWKVEIDRKKVVGEKDPRTSVAWLCPHYVLLGFVEGLAQSGLEELLAYDDDDDEIETLRNPGRLSKDMVSCVGKFMGIPSILIVRSWFKNFNKDQAHLDRYYLMLAIWSCVFFCIYLGVAFVYIKVVPHEAEDEGRVHVEST